jgi:hypothetical protein
VILAGENIVASSIELASAVATALHLEDETVQLYLKNIRAAGAISFKGYGRSAAAMTPLDAARLLIVVVGNGVARNAAAFLEDFAHLKALSEKLPGKKLEDFLTDRIAIEWCADQFPPRGPLKPWGSATAAQAALKLIWIGGTDGAKLPRVAVVRWPRLSGGYGDATFVSRPLRIGRKTFVDEGLLAELYPEAGLIQTRTVTLRAVRDVARSLRDEA